MLSRRNRSAAAFFREHLRQEKISPHARKIADEIYAEQKKARPSSIKLQGLYNRIAPDLRNLQYPGLLEHEINLLVHHANLRPADNITSIGSGTGISEAYLAKEVVPHGVVNCIDFAHEMSKQAKTIKEKTKAGNLRILTASGTALPLRSASQDAVISLNTDLPNTPPWKEVLQEVKRVLRPSSRAKFVFSAAHEKNKLSKEISKIKKELQENGFLVEAIIKHASIGKHAAVLVI